MMQIQSFLLKMDLIYKNICIKNILGFLLILLIPNAIKKFGQLWREGRKHRAQKKRHSREEVLALADSLPCGSTEAKIRKSLQYLEAQKSLKAVQKDLPKHCHSKVRIKQISKGTHDLPADTKHPTTTHKLKTAPHTLSFMQKLQRNYQQQLDVEYSLRLNELLNQAIKITSLEQNQPPAKKARRSSGKKQQLVVVYVAQKKDFQCVFESNHKINYEMDKCQDKPALIEVLELFVRLRKEKVPIYQGNYYKLTKLCLRHDLIEWTAFFLREIYHKKIEISKEILDEFIRKNFMLRLQQQNEEAEHSYSHKRLNQHHLSLQDDHYFSDFENSPSPGRERRVSFDENSLLQHHNNFYKSFFKEFESEFKLIKNNWNSPEEKEETLDSQFYLGKKLNIHSEVYSPIE